MRHCDVIYTFIFILHLPIRRLKGENIEYILDEFCRLRLVGIQIFLILKLVGRHIVNLFAFQGKSDKESLVEAAAKEEEEEEEENDDEEEEFNHHGERGKGKKELKKTKSNLRFGCIPKKPPKEKVTTHTSALV